MSLLTPSATPAVAFSIAGASLMPVSQVEGRRLTVICRTMSTFSSGLLPPYGAIPMPAAKRETSAGRPGEQHDLVNLVPRSKVPKEVLTLMSWLILKMKQPCQMSVDQNNTLKTGHNG